MNCQKYSGPRPSDGSELMYVNGLFAELEWKHSVCEQLCETARRVSTTCRAPCRHRDWRPACNGDFLDVSLSATSRTDHDVQRSNQHRVPQSTPRSRRFTFRSSTRILQSCGLTWMLCAANTASRFLRTFCSTVYGRTPCPAAMPWHPSCWNWLRPAMRQLISCFHCGLFAVLQTLPFKSTSVCVSLGSWWVSAHVQSEILMQLLASHKRKIHFHLKKVQLAPQWYWRCCNAFRPISEALTPIAREMSSTFASTHASISIKRTCCGISTLPLEPNDSTKFTHVVQVRHSCVKHVVLSQMCARSTPRYNTHIDSYLIILTFCGFRSSESRPSTTCSSDRFTRGFAVSLTLSLISFSLIKILSTCLGFDSGSIAVRWSAPFGTPLTTRVSITASEERSSDSDGCNIFEHHKSFPRTSIVCIQLLTEQHGWVEWPCGVPMVFQQRGVVLLPQVVDVLCSTRWLSISATTPPLAFNRELSFSLSPSPPPLSLSVSPSLPLSLSSLLSSLFSHKEWFCAERCKKRKQGQRARPCAVWPRGLSQRCPSQALCSEVSANLAVVVLHLFPAALLIARLCSASLRRSMFNPGPNRPLSCKEMFVFPHSACVAAGASSCPFRTAETSTTVKSTRMPLGAPIHPRQPVVQWTSLSPMPERSLLVAIWAPLRNKHWEWCGNPHRAAWLGLLRWGISVHVVRVRPGGPSTWLLLCHLVSAVFDADIILLSSQGGPVASLRWYGRPVECTLGFRSPWATVSFRLHPSGRDVQQKSWEVRTVLLPLPAAVSSLSVCFSAVELQHGRHPAPDPEHLSLAASLFHPWSVPCVSTFLAHLWRLPQAPRFLCPVVQSISPHWRQTLCQESQVRHQILQRSWAVAFFWWNRAQVAPVPKTWATKLQQSRGATRLHARSASHIRLILSAGIPAFCNLSLVGSWLFRVAAVISVRYPPSLAVPKTMRRSVSNFTNCVISSRISAVLSGVGQ